MASAIVTGAASGIGQATAKRLAKRFDVVAADRDADGLAETVGAIEADGGRAMAVEVDVGDARLEVQRHVTQVLAPQVCMFT